jgi:hypothetical protein
MTGTPEPSGGTPPTPESPAPEPPDGAIPEPAPEPPAGRRASEPAPPPVPWEEPGRPDRAPIAGWGAAPSGALPDDRLAAGWGAHVPTGSSPRPGIAAGVVALVLVVVVALPVVGLAAFGSQLSTILSRAGDAIASSRPSAQGGRPAPGYSGPVPSGRIVGPESLRTGDCFDEAPWDPPDEIRDLIVIPCAELHRYEYIGRFDHPAPASEPYPGDDAIAEFVTDRCATDFTSYVGRSPDRSAYDITWFQPSEDGWRADDRRIDCLAVTDDEIAARGSVRNSDR